MLLQYAFYKPEKSDKPSTHLKNQLFVSHMRNQLFVRFLHTSEISCLSHHLLLSEYDNSAVGVHIITVQWECSAVGVNMNNSY